MRRFRFGISIAGSPTRTQLVETIKRAEAAGFDVVATADHISARHAVFPLLAVASEITTMRLSPMVIANDYRSPVTVARDAATIDILSEGRFELGIGTGWIREQYRQAGLPYDRPGVRVDRFIEAVTVIKGAWSREPFTYTGAHYQVDGVTCPHPVQSPHPPVLIAGAGERMLRFAGAEADIVGLSPLGRGAAGFDDFGPAMARSGDRIEEQLTWIRGGAAGRSTAPELSVMAHQVEPASDVAGKAAALAGEYGASSEQVLASPHILIGDRNRLIDVLQERRERFGISYVVFSGLDLITAEPVVERLAGT